MKTPDRILFATDFTPNARSAADVAGAIALRLNGTVSLVHVADENNACVEGSPDFRMVMKQARAELRQESLRLRRTGVPVEEVLLHGKWAEQAIAEYVGRRPARLAVVSSVSKTAFDRWTLGSVAEHLAENLPVPTLVVRAPLRLLPWLQQARPLEVVVGVDFTVSANAALAFVRELRRIGPCHVTAVHINWPPEETAWSPKSAHPFSVNPEGVQKRLLSQLRRKVALEVEEPFELRVEPSWGRPDAALLGVASRADADLIVLGTHQRRGPGRLGRPSISRGVLRHAVANVACAPVPVATPRPAGHLPGIHKVLVASDLSPAGNQAVPWAYAAVSGGGVVKLVHVLDLHELPKAARRAGGTVRPADLRPRMRAALEKLAALVPANAAEAGIQTETEVIPDRDAAHGIGVAARRFDPDLICLATHPRSKIAQTLFGSVAREVLAQNRPPVLFVKAEEP